MGMWDDYTDKLLGGPVPLGGIEAGLRQRVQPYQFAPAEPPPGPDPSLFQKFLQEAPIAFQGARPGGFAMPQSRLPPVPDAVRNIQFGPPRLTTADYNAARTRLPLDASLADRTAAAMENALRTHFPNANDAFIQQQMAGWRSAGSPSSYSPPAAPRPGYAPSGGRPTNWYAMTPEAQREWAAAQGGRLDAQGRYYPPQSSPQGELPPADRIRRGTSQDPLQGVQGAVPPGTDLQAAMARQAAESRAWIAAAERIRAEARAQGQTLSSSDVIQRANAEVAAQRATGPSGQVTPGGTFNAQGQYVPPPPMPQAQSAAPRTFDINRFRNPGSPAPSVPSPPGGYLNPGSGEQGILPGVLRLSPEELYQHLYGRTAPPQTSRGYGPYRQTTVPGPQEAPLGQFMEPTTPGATNPRPSSLTNRLAYMPTARRPQQLGYEMPLSQVERTGDDVVVNYTGPTRGGYSGYGIRGTVEPDQTLRIHGSGLPSEVQGTGVGGEMYQRIVDWAHAQKPPLLVHSDNMLSKDSFPKYNRTLRELGYDVTGPDPRTKFIEDTGDQYNELAYRYGRGIFQVGPKTPLFPGEGSGPLESRYLQMLKKSPHMLAPFAGVPLGATLLRPGDYQQ